MPVLGDETPGQVLRDATHRRIGIDIDALPVGFVTDDQWDDIAAALLAKMKPAPDPVGDCEWCGEPLEIMCRDCDR